MPLCGVEYNCVSANIRLLVLYFWIKYILELEVLQPQVRPEPRVRTHDFQIMTVISC